MTSRKVGESYQKTGAPQIATELVICFKCENRFEICLERVPRPLYEPYRILCHKGMHTLSAITR